jgi:hypothetical protein
MNPRTWAAVALAALLAAAVILAVCMSQNFTQDRSSRAVLQFKLLLTACEAYRENPKSGNRYPATLAELVEPPFGGGPFLKDPANDLLDPWGNPFKYALVTDGTGKPVPYVWAERTADGKTTLLGAKLTAGGKFEVFGP